MKNFFLLLIALIFCLNLIYAQQPPCMPDYYGLTYSVPRLQEFPPLSIYMPLNVLVGYIALDSISHNMTKAQLQEFLDRQTWNDTIRYIMRILYNVVDYDPILFTNATELGYDDYSIRPEKIESMISKRILELSPETFIHELLLKSGYILHIQVMDTLRRNDPSTARAKTVAIASYNVIDTIKGQALPNCKDINIYLPQQKKSKKDEILDYPSNCMQFEYRLEWLIGQCGDVSYNILDENDRNISLRLIDTNGIPWIKANKEYIVFLSNLFICFDDSGNENIFFSPSPLFCNSKTFGMYPIVDGLVQDPGNDFGLGTSVAVPQFITFLRTKISEISNYNGN